MKRKIPTIIYWLLVSQLVTLGQTKNPAQINDNLYLKGLATYLQMAIKEYKGIKTKRDYCDLIVEKNIDITESLPPQIGDHKLSYKNQAELIEESLKHRTDIPITVIRPIKNEGTKLILSFSEYWFSYKNKKILYSLEGGCKVQMRFDCSKEEYVIEKVNLGCLKGCLTMCSTGGREASSYGSYECYARPRSTQALGIRSVWLR